MKVWYAEVGKHFGSSYIVLSELQVRETAKLYIVESKRDVSSTCTDVRIPKDSENIFKTLDEAMTYIHESVVKYVGQMQQAIDNLHQREKRLTDAYRDAKGKGKV